jgi:hypothetical protein
MGGSLNIPTTILWRMRPLLFDNSRGVLFIRPKSKQLAFELPLVRARRKSEWGMALTRRGGG